ncbi:MAG TPA: hypothetical protein DEB13_02210 [Candidatus Yanofskybacteria bacterium]|nr:hypothetical protein [Candidatus Yanofskybacteria bacterium]
MDQASEILSLLIGVLGFLISFWWVYMPVVLFSILLGSFESYNRMIFLAKMKWVTLQLSVPKETRKSPKATEQMFSALHTVGSSVKPKDRFWKGKVGDWFSFEIVSIGGDIRFIIRTLEANRNLLESQIYAQYPDAEIFEVPDYMADYPDTMPNDEFDSTAGELILTKPDAYPIRTYPEFEEDNAGKDDLKRIDPLSSLSQSLSIIQPGEVMAIQLLIKSADDKWAKAAQGEVDKLMGKKPKTDSHWSTKFIWWLDGLIFGGAPAEKKDDKETTMSQLQFGKQEQIKAIDKSTAKIGFSANIRFIYFAERPKFNKGRPAGITGAFKQFSSQNLNGFKIDGDTKPDGKWPVKSMMEHKKKVKLYKKFKNRMFAAKSYVLNVEELATIYHFPDIGVESPLPRIEAKKGEPPINLPIA